MTHFTAAIHQRVAGLLVHVFLLLSLCTVLPSCVGSAEEINSPPLPQSLDDDDDAIQSNNKKGATRIAFGSCHKSHKATVPSVWELMLGNEQRDDKSLDSFVWTGDAMYSSNRDPVTNKKRYGPAPPSEFQQGFEEMKWNQTIGYTQLLETKIPIYGIWDDHDYGGNDMGIYMPEKEERQQVFWDFLGYKPHDHAGMYHSVDLEEGRIKLILLDTRWFREDHCIPSVSHQMPLGNAVACGTRWATAGLELWKYAGLWGKGDCDQAQILGDAQWQWLEKELKESTAFLHIVVSSVQIFTTNPAMESWAHFPNEKKRLWKLMESHYAEGKAPIVFLSGDVHHAEVSGHSGYLEVTSSGLTHHCGQPKLYGRLCKPILENFDEHRHSHDEYYIGLNYGVLTVDWAARIATVQVKSPDGVVRLEIQQNLDDKMSNLPTFDELPNAWNGHLLPAFYGIIASLIVTLVAVKMLLL